MTKKGVSGTGGAGCVRCVKTYNLLGLCAKKGSIISGGDACVNAIKKGASGLMILAGDSAGNTRDRFLRLTHGRDIQSMVFGSCSELGRRIGRGERSVMLVTDRGLKREICALLGIAVTENGGVEFGKNQGL